MLCLEGLPGIGKKALADVLSDHPTPPRVSPFTPSGTDLELYQADPERWAFLTQLRILLDRTNCLRSSEGYSVMIGSPRSDARCHAGLAGMAEVELALYHDWRRVLEEGLPETKHVYLRGSKEDAFRQVFSRGRRDQSQLGSAHLGRLRERYEEEFNGKSLAIDVPTGAADNRFLLDPAAALVMGRSRP